MPLIDVSIIEGRSPEQLRALVAKLTAGAVEALDAPQQSVRVIIREVPATHWAAGDVTIAERKKDS